MTNIRQLIYVIPASLLFLLAHVFVLLLKLDDLMNFLFILLAMIVTQFLVFRLVKRSTGGTPFTFYGLVGLLCLTQFFSITLLTVYSAVVEHKVVHFMDVLVSIALFVVVLPLLISTIIWFAGAKPKSN